MFLWRNNKKNINMFWLKQALNLEPCASMLCLSVFPLAVIILDMFSSCFLFQKRCHFHAKKKFKEFPSVLNGKLGKTYSLIFIFMFSSEENFSVFFCFFFSEVDHKH